MEKLRSENRFIIKRKDIVLGTVLAAAISVVAVDLTSQGHESSSYTPLSSGEFKPVVLYNANQKDQDLVAHSNPTFEVTPVPLTESKQKLTEYLSQEEKIVSEMEKRHDLFTPKLISDVKTYYPIYKAVSDYYKIDWTMLWITHESETGASGSKVAFDGGSSPYFGAMQRDTNQWPQSDVDEAFNEVFSNLPDIANLKTKQESDASEIAYAGKRQALNYHKYEDLGKEQAIFNTFKLYTASDSLAKERTDRVIAVDKVVNQNFVVSMQIPS